MGKDGGPLSAKAIGKRIKSKGLQKLRWYCQMCQKQCRDANGFKCHIQSEAHLRMMSVFSENAGRFLDEFSHAFEKGFMEIVSRRYRTKKVHCNIVYNEYIADKEHVHLNATRWSGVGQFVQYLGRKGVISVEETDKGFFIQYIDRDPETLAKQERRRKKEQADLDDEQRNLQFIQKQVEKAHANAAHDNAVEEEKHELKRDDPSQQVVMSLAPIAKPLKVLTNVFATTTEPPASASVSHTATTTTATTAPAASSDSRKRERDSGKKLDSTLSDIIHHEEQQRAKKQLKVVQPNWITDGIIVKVLSKKVGGGKYYKQKGTIRKVEDKFLAEVHMIDGGDVIRVDQDDLETVLPALDGRVLIVNGADCGLKATLLKINTEKFNADVRLEQGPATGRVVTLPYEHICKLAT